MPLWGWLLVAAFVVVIIVFTAIVMRARRLDALHKNILKSRAALEHALQARTQSSLQVAQSEILDLASSLVLAEAAQDCAAGAGYVLVDDGLDSIDVGNSELAEVHSLKRGGPDRCAAESELSRVLRLTVDNTQNNEELNDDCANCSGWVELAQARQSVRLTRKFHNIHVMGARRVRKGLVARIFRIHGYASWPQKIEFDDE